MQEINVLGVTLQLLPERAVYIEQLNSLLVADVHLGKSETFQARGIPIPNQVNQQTLERLQQLCSQYELKQLIILGDLFHSKLAMVDEVKVQWSTFLTNIDAKVKLIIGNHDRHLITFLQDFAIDCSTTAIQIDNLILSHEPAPQPDCLNICGHVHPCVRLKSKLDNLRLPCFYLDKTQNLLLLPSFGEFTGSYEMPLSRDAIAYALVEGAIVPLQKK